MDIKNEIRRAIKIADELYYPNKVIRQLKKCKTQSEINRVLLMARHSDERRDK